MDDGCSQLNLLLDLETRHEDLLERLDELDKRVAQVLRQCQPARKDVGQTAGTEPASG
ncbi:MAG: hypothetical protein JXB62_23645 [Pirellulales bacterium]|nr:hypothetical protein [Pirellulales bacterium]